MISSMNTTDTSEIMPLQKLRTLLPSKPAMNTIYNWCLRGVKHRNGKMIVMRSTLEGGRRYSSLDNYYQFRDTLSEYEEV